MSEGLYSYWCLFPSGIISNYHVSCEHVFNLPLPIKEYLYILITIGNYAEQHWNQNYVENIKVKSFIFHKINLTPFAHYLGTKCGKVCAKIYVLVKMTVACFCRHVLTLRKHELLSCRKMHHCTCMVCKAASILQVSHPWQMYLLSNNSEFH